MFRPGYVNALGRKNRPCRPLHKETRRRIVDRYLTGQGPKAISTAARATPGAVYSRFIVSFDTMKRSVHVSQGAFRVRPTPKIRQEVRCCTPSGRKGRKARKMLRQPRPQPPR